MRAALPFLLLTIAAPATAQLWDGAHDVGRTAPGRADPDRIRRNRETHRIDRSVDDGVRSRELSRREAREFRAQAAAIRRSSAGPADGIGTQQDGAVLNLRGLVDARRWEGRQRQAGATERKP